MNYYNLQIKSSIRTGVFSIQFVPQGQPLLFEFWIDLTSHLKRSLPNPISIGHRQRSLHLFRQIKPNSQILVQYAG